MKKLIALVLVFVCVLSLAACGNNTAYDLRITIPAGSQEPFIFADEEICPTGDKITVSAGEGLGDTEVLLQTVNELLTPGYVATPLAPGMSVDFDTAKGEWLKVGVAVQNPTDTDITVYVKVKGVEVRIASADTQDDNNQMAFIGNPWSQWSSIAEAEAAVGFSFGLPETVADSYTAKEFRTMNNEMIEIVYYDGDFEVCVRKQAGEGQDISGDYNEYEKCEQTEQNGAAVSVFYNSGDNACRTLVSDQGYSWSLAAPNGYWGDSAQDFLNLILN